MFTGIIQQTGKISQISDRPEGRNLAIACPGLHAAVAIGDSIAVDGCCLTVNSKHDQGFEAYATYQTLKNTTLGSIKPGSEVNLEPALCLGDRMGGHMVTGHIDTMAPITKIENKGEAFRILISLDRKYSPLIALRGSLAVDGISLTVSEKSSSWFGVAVIPHTYHTTNLCNKTSGSRVNLEIDIIARYIANYMGHANQDQALEEKLKKYGFIE